MIEHTQIIRPLLPCEGIENDFVSYHYFLRFETFTNALLFYLHLALTGKGSRNCFSTITCLHQC